MRVVSLTCSNTEIVCALGCADELVGVDDHSDYPVEVVTGLPRVGPDLGIDVARVAALKPDLVLASLTVPGHERVLENLAAAKLPFFAPEPVSLADVYDDITQIAARLGVPARGAELAQRMQHEIAAVTASVAPRLLVEWWPKPVIVPGRKSWVQDLIERAGGENPFALRDVKSTPITDAEAVRAAPDAVIMSWCGVRLEKYRAEVVYRRPAWQTIPALAKRQVFAVPEAFLGRPGPRLVEGFRALRDIVQSIERLSASSI
ncbi:MAG TPA: cobalamin-binding protein [Polyangiaceae bacterium]